MARVDAVLLTAIASGASDIHLAVGAPPTVRRFGQLSRLDGREVEAEQTRAVLDEILAPAQREQFKQDMEIDFAYEIPDKARFRCNAFTHRRGIDICFRAIKPDPPTFADLGLPDIMKRICDNHQGLILITGGAGSGKSTTLAAIVNYINSNRPHHVLTLEDPIEIIHPIKKGAVNQRQLGKHTLSYANSLRAALRENPDVIVVGDLRDLETITLAISASETGHLVIGSMNTSSAHKTVDKVTDSYPPGQQAQIRAMLGESLRAVFTQRLVPRADGKGIVLAYELLLGSLQLAALIRDCKTFQIPNLMTTGRGRGLRAMDDSLVELYQQKVITRETALKNAVNLKLFAAEEKAETLPEVMATQTPPPASSSGSQPGLPIAPPEPETNPLLQGPPARPPAPAAPPARTSSSYIKVVPASSRITRIPGIVDDKKD